MASSLDLGTLVVSLVADVTKFHSNIKSAEVGMLNAANRMSVAANRMSLMVTAPLTFVGGMAVREMAKFDRAMVEAISIMEDMSPTIRKQMEEVAKSLSAQSIYAPETLAKAYYELASAGLSAEQSMKALPTVANFATAGVLDLAKSTEYLTNIQNALGLSIGSPERRMKEMTRIADVLSKVNEEATGSAESFAKALTTKSAAALRSVNKSIEEGAAVLAVYAEQGVHAELAGERLSIVIRDLQTAFRNNSEVWDHHGIAVFNAAGEMRSFIDIIRDMERAMADMTVEQRSALLAALGFQDRSVHGIRQLVGMSDRLEYFNQKMAEAGGTTERVATVQMTAFSNQMSILWNNVRLLGIEFGENLAPGLSVLSDALKLLLSWWRELPGVVKSSIVIFTVFTGAIAMVIGPIMKIGALWLKGYVAIRHYGGALKDLIVTKLATATATQQVTAAQAAQVPVFTIIIPQVHSTASAYRSAAAAAIQYTSAIAGLASQTTALVAVTTRAWRFWQSHAAAIRPVAIEYNQVGVAIRDTYPIVAMHTIEVQKSTSVMSKFKNVARTVGSSVVAMGRSIFSAVTSWKALAIAAAAYAAWWLGGGAAAIEDQRRAQEETTRIIQAGIKARDRANLQEVGQLRNIVDPKQRMKAAEEGMLSTERRLGQLTKQLAIWQLKQQEATYGVTAWGNSFIGANSELDAAKQNVEQYQAEIEQARLELERWKQAHEEAAAKSGEMEFAAPNLEVIANAADEIERMRKEIEVLTAAEKDRFNVKLRQEKQMLQEALATKELISEYERYKVQLEEVRRLENERLKSQEASKRAFQTIQDLQHEMAKLQNELKLEPEDAEWENFVLDAKRQLDQLAVEGAAREELLVLEAMLAAHWKINKAVEERHKAQEKLKQEQEELTRQREREAKRLDNEAERLRASIQTPEEKFRKEWDQIDKLFKTERIGWDEASKGFEKIFQDYLKALDPTIDQDPKRAKAMELGSSESFSAIQSAIDERTTSQERIARNTEIQTKIQEAMKNGIDVLVDHANEMGLGGVVEGF